jgi:regulatory protein YycH of two-component signal transduction system YycFG
MMNVSPEMSQSDWLKLAESRLDNMKIYNTSNTSEIFRLENAVNDIQSKMTETELSQYNASKNVVLTAKEIEANRLAMVKAMNENRDKPSI